MRAGRSACLATRSISTCSAILWNVWIQTSSLSACSERRPSACSSRPIGAERKTTLCSISRGNSKSATSGRDQKEIRHKRHIVFLCLLYLLWLIFFLVRVDNEGFQIFLPQFRNNS